MDAADLAYVVDGAQVRAAELSGGAGLAIEAFDDQRASAQERRFQGHVALELRVVGEIDSTHRAPADQADDLVAPETFVGREDRNRAWLADGKLGVMGIVV